MPVVITSAEVFGPEDPDHAIATIVRKGGGLYDVVHLGGVHCADCGERIEAARRDGNGTADEKGRYATFEEAVAAVEKG